MELSTIELKFLLQLLGYSEYRSPIEQIKPNPKTSASERDSVCRSLVDKGWVEISEAIAQFAIAPPGKTLLSLDTTSLPVTPDELLVLQTCLEKSIAPEDLPNKLQGTDAQQLIQNLAQRGLVKIRKVQIQDVWLSPQGILYLRDECEPEGTANILSFDGLSHYLRFLRKTLEPAQANPYEMTKPTSEEILQIIRDLDRALNTGNYLPIFYLRDKLQPPLTREEFDQTLYFLQRNDLIELGSIQEVTAYTPDQLKAGIPQNVGGALFFVSLL